MEDNITADFEGTAGAVSVWDPNEVTFGISSIAKKAPRLVVRLEL